MLICEAPAALASALAEKPFERQIIFAGIFRSMVGVSSSLKQPDHFSSFINVNFPTAVSTSSASASAGFLQK
jgi:hypothetical protein